MCDPQRGGDRPRYLTDHGAAVEEIGVLAALLARVISCANRRRSDPLAALELTILAAQASQRESVQSAAAALYRDGITS